MGFFKALEGTTKRNDLKPSDFSQDKGQSKSQPQPDTKDITNSLERILDEHAVTYVKSTKEQIVGNIDEKTRDSVWRQQDKKTKQQIEQYIEKEMVEARIDELNSLYLDFDDRKIRHIDGTKLTKISDRIAQLQRTDT